MTRRSLVQPTEEEAENLRMLSDGNPFIVRYIDFLPMQRPKWFQLTPLSFLIMENCEGGSLSDWIERRQKRGRWTSAEEVALIGAQVISALAFCHSRDVAHLDVKPQNVFIKRDGITIRVGDFGSVMQLQSIEATVHGSSTDGVKNTLIYTPPGMNSMSFRRSARLDVWGFGHIIQELLTFEHAFCRVDGRPTQIQPKIVQNICENKRTKLVEIRGENEELNDFEILLLKCLNPRKQLRPENALQLRGEGIFAEFLERIESGESPNEIIAPPEEIIRRLRETNQQQESVIEEQNRRIRELESKLEKNEKRKKKNRELKQICEEQQENEQKFIGEIANLKQKLKEQEADLEIILAENERKNQVEENLIVQNRNQRKQIADLKRELDEFRNRRHAALNERQQRGVQPVKQTMQFQQQMNEQMMLNQTQQAPPPVQNMGDVMNSAEGQKRLKNFEPSEESEDFSSEEEKKPKKNKKKHLRRSSSYSSRLSSRGRTKTSTSKEKSKARKSSSSYSRGSSIERELAQIKIRDKYAVIPVKAHEPKMVIMKKSPGQSFGMKLGTRVFVQSINPGGVAENNDVHQNDLILSVDGASTDFLTIPEVLEKMKGSDTLVLEVQQIDGGTVTLPSTVLNQSSSERGSPSKHSLSKKVSKSSKRRAERKLSKQNMIRPISGSVDTSLMDCPSWTQNLK